MKPEEIKDLLSFVSASGLDEVNIETDKFKMTVKRSSAPVYVTQQMAPAPAAAPLAALAPSAQPVAAAPTAAPAPANANRVTIKAPMIGTYYSSPNPESAKFVAVGDEIKVGQVLCIIEAMKLFNEIESEIAGTVVQIILDNSTPVEYDQPLFVVDLK